MKGTQLAKRSIVHLNLCGVCRKVQQPYLVSLQRSGSFVLRSGKVASALRQARRA